jgi:uncharacterized protein with PIN domain
MSSQLWELLVKIELGEANDKLSCGECFAVMELLAGGAELGIDQKRLERLARQHLSRCPDCREKLWKRLGELVKNPD